MAKVSSTKFDGGELRKNPNPIFNELRVVA
jgi:hypothetical protein